MKLSAASRKGVGTFDLTPMIDVVMQLLIFFLFTSQFASMARSPMDLPKQSGEEAEAEVPAELVIDVHADGRAMIESRAVTREELTRAIQAEIARQGDAAAVDVLVRADRVAPARFLNEVANELIRLKVRNWRLGTQDPGGEKPTGGNPGGTP
ncbi:MAG: ExbD/TolR family protein [Phycisphaerales bacterium]